MSSETAICVYCGEPWKLEDGMCHKCENGAKLPEEFMDQIYDCIRSELIWNKRRASLAETQGTEQEPRDEQ